MFVHPEPLGVNKEQHNLYLLLFKFIKYNNWSDEPQKWKAEVLVAYLVHILNIQSKFSSLKCFVFICFCLLAIYKVNFTNFFNTYCIIACAHNKYNCTVLMYAQIKFITTDFFSIIFIFKSLYFCLLFFWDLLISLLACKWTCCMICLSVDLSVSLLVCHSSVNIS